MPFVVYTEHPIAVSSRDHIYPHGTKNDNSSWKPFNEKLYRLLKDKYFDKPYQIMDLGCSGGKFVKDCLDDGHIAIGLEGSDFSMLSSRAEWATIPENLFCCDVTKPFTVNYGEYDYDDRNEKYFHTLFDDYRFDVITAWELMEHIPEEDLPQMLTNCKNHLVQDGYMIFSVSPNEEFWHVCVHDKEWWLKKFKENGLVNRQDLVEYFGDDWIRGPRQGAINSFHVVLQLDEK